MVNLLYPPPGKGDEHRHDAPHQFLGQDLGRLQTQQIGPVPLQPVLLDAADVRLGHLDPDRQLLLGDKGSASIPGAASPALRARHFQQAQEEHQHPHPERSIPRHPRGEMAAESGLVASIFLAHHLRPGLFPTANQTAQTYHRYLPYVYPLPHRRTTGRLPNEPQQRAQSQPQIADHQQPLTLPQQPTDPLPFRLAAQPGPHKADTLPQPQHPGHHPHPGWPHLPTQVPQTPQQQAADQQDGPGVR